MAVVDLGLSEGDFLSATPRMLVAAMERKRETDEAAMRLENHRIGTLAAAVYTAQGVTGEMGKGKPRNPWTAADFFAGLEVEGDEPPGQSMQDQIAAIDKIFSAFGNRARRTA